MADKGIDLQDPLLTDYPGTGPLPDEALFFVQNPTTRKSHRATAGRVRGAGGSGAGGPAKEYTSTENVGGVRAGDTFKTADPGVVQMLVTYQAPSFPPFTIGDAGSRTLLVGTALPAGFKSVKWSTTNKGNVAPKSISLVDLTSGSALLSNEDDDGTASASTASFTVVLNESRRYRLSGKNDKGDTFSTDLVISGAHETYLGASTSPSLTPAQIVALGGAQLQGDRSRTATGVTTSGGQYLYYAYPAAFGDLTSIILDGAAPVLGAFQKVGDFQVTNNAGAGLTVRLYRSNATNAFTNNSLAFA
jgi:hypothetical protein